MPAERFGKLLVAFSIIPHRHLDRALDVYDAALAESGAERGAGAYCMISSAGRSIMVVTEGPHDAQATTISRLGIAPYVDLLVTSRREGLQMRRVLKCALDKAGCAPSAAIYVGDSVECDIAPARALGIRAIYAGEQDQAPDVETSASLADLTKLFSQGAQLLQHKGQHAGL